MESKSGCKAAPYKPPDKIMPPITPLKSIPSLFIGLTLLGGFLLFPIQSTLARSPENPDFQIVSFKRPFPPPPFSLDDLSGAKKTLESYRGQHVLLNFWATWCVPCLKEMPAMEMLFQRFRHHQFTVVAISIDEEGQAIVKKFTEKLNITFPILLDPQKSTSQVYGVKNLPSSFILNPEGNVIAAAKGEREWFSKEALSYLEELLNES